MITEGDGKPGGGYWNYPPARYYLHVGAWPAFVRRAAPDRRRVL